MHYVWAGLAVVATLTLMSVGASLNRIANVWEFWASTMKESKKPTEEGKEQ